jgi:outer membrane lipoprotein-sorting protein
LNYDNLDEGRFKTKNKLRRKEHEPMKKIATSCIVGLFLFGILASPGTSQTTEEIVAKMIKAQGGKAALEKIKDTTLSGTMEIVQMGMSGTLTYYHKEPNKMRMDMEFMGMVMTQAYDGENAWGVNPQTGGIEDMPEDQAKDMQRQALGNDAVLHPEKYGITYAYKGKETIEGKDYYVLEQTFEDGFTTTLYIDTNTGLLYKSKSKGTGMMGGEVDQEVLVSDYKKVEGLMVAHKMQIIQEGEEAITMTFTDVKFNSGLEDTFFKK